MFDFGLGTFELLMIAIVAIIVVGPKDLPKLLRTVGQFMTKVRGLAREFQGYMDEAARETGLDDVKSEVSKMTDFSVDDITGSAVADVKSAISESAPKTESAKSESKSTSKKTKSKKTSPAKLAEKASTSKATKPTAKKKTAKATTKSKPRKSGAKA